MWAYCLQRFVNDLEGEEDKLTRHTHTAYTGVSEKAFVPYCFLITFIIRHKSYTTVYHALPTLRLEHTHRNRESFSRSFVSFERERSIPRLTEYKAYSVKAIVIVTAAVGCGKHLNKEEKESKQLERQSATTTRKRERESHRQHQLLFLLVLRRAHTEFKRKLTPEHEGNPLWLAPWKSC